MLAHAVAYLMCRRAKVHMFHHSDHTFVAPYAHLIGSAIRYTI